jgi:Leucine-rich repeat (LRR) protein
VPFLPLWATRPSLQFLALNNNGLAGSVPSSLSKLTSLEYLFLDDNNNNNLSGGIPDSLTKLAALKELILNNN